MNETAWNSTPKRGHPGGRRGEIPYRCSHCLPTAQNHNCIGMHACRLAFNRENGLPRQVSVQSGPPQPTIPAIHKSPLCGACLRLGGPYRSLSRQILKGRRLYEEGRPPLTGAKGGIAAPFVLSFPKTQLKLGSAPGRRCVGALWKGHLPYLILISRCALPASISTVPGQVR